MLSECLFIFFVYIDPVLHIIRGLPSEARLDDECVKHGLSFYGEKAGVDSRPIGAFFKDFQVVRRSVLQKLSCVTTTNRQDTAICKLCDPGFLEQIASFVQHEKILLGNQLLTRKASKAFLEQSSMVLNVWLNFAE